MMNRPVRTTLIFSLFSGFVFYPVMIRVLAPWLGWPTAIKLIFWAQTGIYAIFLARWSQVRLPALIFPLLLLLGAALWPHARGGFALVLLGTWVWIRSGICFPQHPLRAVFAEGITALGGMLLVGGWRAGSLQYWSLAIWLFGLVQCLYFYIMPLDCRRASTEAMADPFETARRNLEHDLDQSWSS